MNRRDLELLSSYLDGQLKPSDSARLEARLASDPDLRAVLDDLRAARGLLRQLPMRKAPRNFTLTPKMVGKNPPLPRSYPAFRFVTALASLMLFFTLGLNFVVPQMTQTPAFGFGGGAPEESFSVEQVPAAPEAAATEAPAAEAPPEEPSVLLGPLPTPTISPAADSAVREVETPADKQGVTNETDVTEPPQPRPLPPPVPPTWQIALAAIALLSALIMVVMRQSAASRWRQK
jgi:hypothetical protein